MHDWRSEYKALTAQLQALVADADAGDTGRAEDDIFVKVAILGFGRHAPQDEWGWKHFLEVRQWREGDYSDDALSTYGPVGARRYALLACAWLGTVLGLFHKKAISEPDALTAYALLAGFVAVDAFEVLEREFG